MPFNTDLSRVNHALLQTLKKNVAWGYPLPDRLKSWTYQVQKDLNLTSSKANAAALAVWRPEDILVVRETRQVRVDERDGFDPPPAPRILTRTTHELRDFAIWRDRAWVDATDRTEDRKQ